MVEITKPDGEVIHLHNQHHNTTSANVYIYVYIYELRFESL